MARLRIDANQHRIVASLRGLQRRRIFERMRGYDPIVVVRSRRQCRRILRSHLDVMDWRVGLQHLELGFVRAGAVVRDPVPTNRELMEPQHVHHARLLDHGPEQFRSLIRHCADQESAI